MDARAGRADLAEGGVKDSTRAELVSLLLAAIVLGGVAAALLGVGK